MLLWWLAASLSSAVYFHPEVMLDERTELRRCVRSLPVTTCAAMASLAVAALFPSRIDVALSCAGDAPEALRCLTAYGLVYVCGFLSVCPSVFSDYVRICMSACLFVCLSGCMYV